MNYREESFGEGGRLRNGSPRFYKLLDEMAETHDKKSHDYASNENPSGNYHFAGSLAKLFNNHEDAGFVGRIGEKIYRLANLENSGKQPTNESIEDTERDIAVITCLWMADRRDRRAKFGVREVRSWESPAMSEEGKRVMEATSQQVSTAASKEVIELLHSIAATTNRLLNLV